MAIRCLVTGYRGYIGSRVYKALKKMGCVVRGIDLKDGLDIIHDLNHKRYKCFRPEYIFHLAAIPRVPYSMEFPEEVLENNVLSTIRILEYARKNGAKRVIYSSSSSVVGNGDGPTSPYGASKLIPEILCKNYSDVYGLDTVSLRYFNVYSEDQEVDGPYATAIANFMDYIRKGKDPYITGAGDQRRDMIHVSDVVSANIFCMNYKGNFKGRHYDTATGSNISLNEVASIVNKYFPNVTFSRISERSGDVRETRADIAPLESLGWKTKINIEQGINSCFQKLKERE